MFEASVDGSDGSNHIWPVVIDGRVFATTLSTLPTRTIVTSLDAADGSDAQSSTSSCRRHGAHRLSPTDVYTSGARTGYFGPLTAGNMTLDWSTTLSGSIESSHTSRNSVVYVTSDVGSGNVRLYALDAVTGEVLWSTDVPDATTYTPSPIVANGVLYLVSAGIGGDGLYAFANTVPGPDFVDIAGNVFEDDIRWLAAEEITEGL